MSDTRKRKKVMYAAGWSFKRGGKRRETGKKKYSGLRKIFCYRGKVGGRRAAGKLVGPQKGLKQEFAQKA